MSVWLIEHLTPRGWEPAYEFRERFTSLYAAQTAFMLPVIPAHKRWSEYRIQEYRRAD